MGYEKRYGVVAGIAALMLTAACSGTKSTTVTELTQYDKQMNCTELELDIAEATFLRDKAERNRGLSFRNVVMPLSYPSTYMSSGDAIQAASNRIEYLSRLSEIKGCNARQQYAAMGMEQGYGQPMPQGVHPQMQYAAPMPEPAGYAAPGHYPARPSYGY